MSLLRRSGLAASASRKPVRVPMRDPTRSTNLVCIPLGRLPAELRHLDSASCWLPSSYA